MRWSTAWSWPRTIEMAVCRMFAGDRLDRDGPAKGSKYVSSVDRQAGACHVRRLLAGEIGDQAGDLTWLSNSSKGNQGFHHLQVIDCHIRLGRPRLNIVDGYRARREVQRDTFYHGRHGRLGHRIDTGTGKAGANGGVAAYGDHASAIGEPRRGRLNGHEHAPHVDVQHPIEILEADSFDGAQAQNTGVDDDDVEPAKPVDGLSNGVLNRSCISAVGFYGQSLSAHGFDCFDGPCCLVRRAYPGKGDVRAILGQALDDRCANTARPAENHRDFS